MIWGDALACSPSGWLSDSTTLASYLSFDSWPWGHRAPDLQHQSVDKTRYVQYATGAYRAYLLDPPAPVYNVSRPIPIQYYAPFLRESWWQNDFQKYGQQALKIWEPPDTFISISNNHGKNYNTRYYRLNLLAAWLLEETEEIVAGQVTVQRLRFEARTWNRKYQRLRALSDQIISGIDSLSSLIGTWLAVSTAGTLSGESQTNMVANFNQHVRTIYIDYSMELNRLLNHMIKYVQAIISLYSVVPDEAYRRLVHQQYMVPLRGHIQSTGDRLNAVMLKVEGFTSGIQNDPRLAVPSILTPRIQILYDAIIDFRNTTSTYTRHLEYLIALMDDDLVAPGFDYSRYPSLLPAVPDARKRMTFAQSLRKAADRSLRYISGGDRPYISNVTQRWLQIIRSMRPDFQRENRIIGVAGEDTVMGGT
ncbi:hypothetical protein N8I77_002833 [Diaporthe amygdali]|uniref:Uncharacterized protein n=1 Tax=Phomopsis amygdali TaxID=1214568 RepID=A0AAD9W9T7_PHOAM|nr:hypothetical protein N8I77_002833 [Diaporthe amygdali]